MFMDLLGHARLSSPGALSYAVLGAANYLTRFPGASDVRRFLSSRASELASACGPGWLEEWNGPDWPVAAQALTIAGQTLTDVSIASRADELIVDLREVTRQGSVFVQPGAGGRNEEMERPATAATFIDALGAAYYVNQDEALLGPMRAAADWFLGANSRALPLFDFATGGCCDALSASGLNHNQGTEATANCLIAFLTLYDIGGTQHPEGTSSAGEGTFSGG